MDKMDKCSTTLNQYISSTTPLGLLKTLSIYAYAPALSYWRFYVLDMCCPIRRNRLLLLPQPSGRCHPRFHLVICGIAAWVAGTTCDATNNCMLAFITIFALLAISLTCTSLFPKNPDRLTGYQSFAQQFSIGSLNLLR